ncbi:MAG TPA: ASCH domain-containing protein [Desulfotomaculum sp.]|nr:MAG: hypothetical protein JL56_02815 [Desulfotomaculum sp. BICA1-6]HBX22633.1 ASCH domain-containing protein [Desulfotomaculum sp.]
MKTLSLIQPWATLVAIGAKRIETRSWATKYRGPLAIHASKKVDRVICLKKEFAIPLNEHGFVLVKDLPVGAVIATCTLVDCMKVRTLRPVKRDGKIVMTAFLEAENSLLEVNGNELAFGDYTPGRYAWILEDVRTLPEPVPAKGMLGLWSWEPPEEVGKQCKNTG